MCNLPINKKGWERVIFISYMLLLICILISQGKENASVKYCFFTDSSVLTSIVCNWWVFKRGNPTIGYGLMGSKSCLINWLRFWWNSLKWCLLYHKNLAVSSVQIIMYEGIQKKRTKNNRETSLCIILFEYIYILCIKIKY